MITKGIRKVVAIVGPTGTGKTSFALKLAKEFDGELINCDSRQVYRGMDIGTNKGEIWVTTEIENYKNKIINAFNIENSNIKGWLFDILEPNEQLNLAEYQEITYFIIDKIQARGHLPILVGGTGLYLDALVKGYRLSPIKPDIKLRENLGKLNAEKLFDKLFKLNKGRAILLNESDSHNPRRLIRAIEESIAQLSDKKDKTIQLDNVIKKLDIVIVYPDFKREDLFLNIDARVLEMVASGLIEETKKIINNYSQNLEILKGIGYKEVIEFLNEKITLSEMIAKIQQGHRNYAKRQITWFEGEKRNYDLLKIDFNQENLGERINEIILQLQS